MIPIGARVKDLQERFGVRDGQFNDPNRYQNLNWYFSSDDKTINTDADEWFCFGDILDSDIPRIMSILSFGEAVILGWKDMPRNVKQDEFFGDGGGVRMVIKPEGVVYDGRRDYPQKFEGL